MVRCFVCGKKSIDLDFNLRVVKLTCSYNRHFCSRGCLETWLKKSSTNLKQHYDPPEDDGEYIEKCFYPKPDESPKTVKRKKKHD